MSILKTWIFETKDSHITFSDKKLLIRYVVCTI